MTVHEFVKYVKCENIGFADNTQLYALCWMEILRGVMSILGGKLLTSMKKAMLLGIIGKRCMRYK